jgi:ABC-type Co2+ transport system permease subunit
MNDREGLLGGSGCLLVFIVALLAIAYLIYSRDGFHVVYEEHPVQDTMDRVQQMNEQKDH